MALTEDELKNICIKEMEDADLGMEEVREERQTNLEMYLNEPLGNEVEGRSKVQTSDISDAIEWLLPQLLEIFVSTINPLEFVPNTKEDIDDAQQTTDYVQYVINQQNTGFLNLQTWFKDALLQKNGILKVFWDESTLPEQESYENVSHGEYLEIISDDEVEIKEEELFIDGEEADAEQLNAPPETQEEALIRLTTFTHSVTVERKNDVQQVRVQNIAPENFLIRRNHNSIDLKDVQFCGHLERTTVGEAISDGFDKDKVLAIPSESRRITSESTARHKDTGGEAVFERISIDPMSREIIISECYMRVDFDGDDIPELMKVTIGGSKAGSSMLDFEEVDSIPFIAITPVVMSHKFYGRAIADLLKEIQRIKTAILRQTLDSLYIHNAPRPIANPNFVDVQSLLDPEIGAPILADDINQVSLVQMPFVGNSTLPMLELMDDYGERKSGVSKAGMAIDPHILKDTSMVVSTRMLNMAQQRVQYIARIFAETGYKVLVQKVHELTSKFEQNSKVFELNGEYVEVDPRSWRKKRDLRCRVGTGNSTKELRLAALQNVIQQQKEIVAQQGGIDGPFVTGENIHNSLTDMVELSGVADPARYFSFVEPPPPPPPQPNPIAEAAMADIELRAQKDAADLRLKQQQHEDKVAIEREKATSDALFKDRELALKEQQVQSDAADKQADNQTDQQKLVLDQKKHDDEIAFKDKELEVDTELEIAKMRNQGPPKEQNIITITEGEGAESMSKAAESIVQASKNLTKERRVVTDKDGNVIGTRTVDAD